MTKRDAIKAAARFIREEIDTINSSSIRKRISDECPTIPRRCFIAIQRELERLTEIANILEGKIE